MEHGQIADTQISASESFGPEYAPTNGRLNAVMDDNRACWCPSDNDTNAWFQVDFKVKSTVTSVHIQGNPASAVDERVASFEVSSSFDGVNFVYYMENGIVKV